MQIFGDDSSDDNSETKASFEPKNLGVDPKTGYEIFVKLGPYGPYLELVGSEIESKNDDNNGKSEKKSSKKAGTKKPKRISIPKNIDINQIELEYASKLLTLPREVGIHPDTGQKIVANIGPFGPYLLHDKKFTSVKEDNIMEIGLNRAIDLIADSAQKKESKQNYRKNKKK